MSEDDVMPRIMRAIEAGRGGDAVGARGELTSIWDEIGEGGDPFHRCVLAHYLADLQDEVADELAWDLRSLEAVAAVTDERAQSYHASLQVRGFLPSLHLNVADDLRRLGDPDSAREQLALAARAADALPEDGYGDTIRSGIANVGRALDAGSTDPLATHHP